MSATDLLYILPWSWIILDVLGDKIVDIIYACKNKSDTTDSEVEPQSATGEDSEQHG